MLTLNELFQKKGKGDCPWGRGLLIMVLVLAFAFSALPVKGSYAVGKDDGYTYSASSQQEVKKLYLSLRDALEMAMERNLNIQIERYNTRISDERVGESMGFFDYQSTLSTSYSKSQSEPWDVFSAQDINISDNYTLRGGITKNLVTGANFQVSYTEARRSSNSPFSNYNPYHRPVLSLQFTQPLWKNFGVENTKYNITIAQNNSEMSDKQFRAQLMTILAEVQRIYWELVFRIQNLEVNRQSLKLAQDQLQMNRTKVEVGTMAPIEVTQAEAAVASREEGIIVGESAIRDAQDQLKMAIDPTIDLDSWEVEFIPTDKPPFELQSFNLQECIETAFENRPEYDMQKIAISSKELSIRHTKNQMRPAIDLVASFAANGLDGLYLIYDKRSLEGGKIVDVIEGGFGGAMKDVFSLDYRDWNIGFNISLPIQNRAAESAHARSKVELTQEEARLKNLELSIILEVRQAVRAVDTNIKRVEATRKARELAEKQLEAEQKKFAVGTSTNFEVLSLQTDLATAMSNERRSIVDYNISLFTLQKVMGTLLKDSNIVVKD
ncbi:MAG: TolC family protein [Candidatus Aminicenantes bacterium]|nr:TolC family protein [Candidatus Aminicenantes bacterium]